MIEARAGNSGSIAVGRSAAPCEQHSSGPRATWYWLSFAIALTLFAIAWMVSMGGEFKKGYGIKELACIRSIRAVIPAVA
jgi:hypothetical protein